MAIRWPSCFFNLWSSWSSRPKQRRSCRLLLPLVAGCAAAEASPPPYYSHSWPGHPPLHSPTPPVILRRRQRSRTSEPSYSSPCGHPLPRLPRLRVVPFLGLAIIHRLVLSARRGQCGQRPTSIGRVLYIERLTAGSTAAARKCLLITGKIMIPPPNSWDPPDGPLYFAKKKFPP